MSTGSLGTGVLAELWESASDGRVQCTACAHRCTLDPGQRGICDVRMNVAGELRLLTYGTVYDKPFGPPGTADPIEKKPLYHYKPGTRVLSFGGASCNFACQFCQNHHIAFADPEDLELRDVSPAEAASSATDQHCESVAWTYNEPTIYAEYVRDGAQAAKDEGLGTVIVTNGYFTEEFADLLAPVLDAANVDIKGFRERPHVKYMGSRLAPTLRGAEYLVDRDVHVELTYLTIPDLNDDPEEIRDFAEWAYGLDPTIPVHFTRFHPDYEMQDRPSTPIATLEESHEIATDVGLEYVYVGNVLGATYSDTVCPDCGETWISRQGFDASIVTDLSEPCQCGREKDIVL
ncbi:MAG: AmmeMemoRadiSam system radical SAM enzyme [Halobacteriota archaeon]